MNIVSAMTFQSPRFDMSWPEGVGDPNDVPLGRDLAKFLVDGLRAEGVSVTGSSPSEGETFWLVGITMDEVPFDIHVHWAPLKDSKDDWWVVRFFPNRRKLRKEKDHVEECCHRLQQIISNVLSEDDSLKHPEWMTEAEFQALY